jgi:hypothetical protein
MLQVRFHRGKDAGNRVGNVAHFPNVQGGARLLQRRRFMFVLV